MGERTISRAEELSPAWRALAKDFLAPGYREAMSTLTGFDLTNAPLEVNVFHYPPGGILRSAAAAVVRTISPVVGNSAVLVRSDDSWHAVSPVVKSCRLSRRSLTATFYRQGSVSTMWPPGDQTSLHHYAVNRWERWWNRIT